MSSLVAGRNADRARGAAALGGFAAAALGFGALFAYVAFLLHPLALPAALAGLTLVAITLVRPVLGVAAVFPLLVVGNLHVLPGPPWVLGFGWAVFLFAAALVLSPPQAAGERLPPLSLPLAAYLAVTAAAAGAAGALAVAAPTLRSLVTGLLIFAAIVILVRRVEDLVWILGGIAAAGLLASLFAAYQWRYGDPLGIGFITDTGELVYRVSAGFGHPNQLGGFLVILSPYLLAGIVLHRRARLFYLLAFAGVLFGIYVSFSRGALIAAAVVPLFFMRPRHLFALAPVVAIVVLSFAPDLLRERFGTLAGEGSELASRLDIWTTAYRIWVEHPLLGVGPGGFPDAYASVRVPGKDFVPASIFEAPPHAHNVVLQLLSEQGILGLLAVVAIFVTAAYTAVTLRRDADPRLAAIGTATLASLTAFWIHNQFDVTLLESNGIFLVGLFGLVAVAAVLARSRAEREDPIP